VSDKVTTNFLELQLLTKKARDRPTRACPFGIQQNVWTVHSAISVPKLWLFLRGKPGILYDAVKMLNFENDLVKVLGISKVGLYLYHH
jgi:hypothetical protein